MKFIIAVAIIIIILAVFIDARFLLAILLVVPFLQKNSLRKEVQGGAEKKLGRYTEKEVFRITNSLGIGRFRRSVKPEWLHAIDALTGEKIQLELDVYSEKLRVAIEYNGPQHYDYSYWNDMYSYAKYIQNGFTKEDLCAKNSVELIIIPYTVPNKDLKDYIKSRLYDLEVIEKKPKRYIKKIVEPKIKHANKIANMVVSRKLGEAFEA